MLKIIVVSGLPGSGKSTLSEVISTKLGFPIFSVDPIESAIIKSGIKRSFETGLAVYLAAQSLGAEQLKLNHSIIIDAVNSMNVAREMWTQLADDYSASIYWLEVYCSDKELHRKRVEARVRNLHGIAEVTWKDVLKREKEFQAWDSSTSVLRLDTVQDGSDNVQKALEHIVKS